MRPPGGRYAHVCLVLLPARRCRVTQVRPSAIDVERKDGSRASMPFGTCIWATGIAMHPFVAGLKAKLPEELQTSRR